MRSFYLLSSLIFFNIVFANVSTQTPDTQESNNKTQKQKDVKSQKENNAHTTDMTESALQKENNPSQDKSETTPHEENNSKQDNPEDTNKTIAKEKNGTKQSLIWFVGGSASTQINLQYKEKSTRFLGITLNGGIFYHIGSAHGIKGFISASYNTLGNSEYFAVGGGVDYFYDFQSLGVGLFLGVYADMPISTPLLKEVDVIASAGASYSINTNNRFEVRCGYPIMQDPTLKRSLAILISYQYLFKTRK